MEKSILDKYKRSAIKSELKRKEMYEICLVTPIDEISIDTLAKKAYISRGTYFNYFGNLDGFMIQLYKYIIAKEFAKNRKIDLEFILENYAYTGILPYILKHFISKRTIRFCPLEVDICMKQDITDKEIDYLTDLVNDKNLFTSIVYKIIT